MNPDFLFSQGFRAQQRGALAEAEAAYRAVLAMRPTYTDAWLNIGVMMVGTGRFGDAAEAFREVVRMKPTDAKGWANLGVALRGAGDPEGAIAAYEQAGRLAPDSGPLHLNLGNLRMQMGQPEEALEHFMRLPSLIPDRPNAWLGISRALHELGRTEEGVRFLDQVLSTSPGLPEFLLNRGILCLALNRPGEAEKAFLAALRGDPSMVEAEYSLGLARMLQGDLPGGFAGLESRWRRKETLQSPPPSAAPRWKGEPLAGRTLLVHAEQGMGDLIQMAQLLVRIQGGAVVYQVWPALTRLLAQVAGASQVVSSEHPMPLHDLIIPAMSLPLALGLHLEHLSGTAAYLGVALDASEKSRTKSFGRRDLHVGICWRGRPEHTNDRRRSVDPSLLWPALETPGIRWSSLQKDPRPEELQALGSPQDLGSGFRDFADTAAAMAAMDGVVTVDTAIAHLAGALGKPTLLMLPFAPDARWMLNREDSPWYGSLRLFRQSSPGAWGFVVNRVRAALSGWVDGTL